MAASGFALVGVHTYPEPDTDTELLQLVLDQRGCRDLVMLSSSCSGRIVEKLHGLIEAKPLPPVIVLPSGGDESAWCDPAVAAAYRAIGLET